VTAWRRPLLLVAASACVVAPALVAAGVESFVTVLAAVLLFALAPGAAVLPLLAPRGRALELGLVVGVSLAVTTLVAQGMLWTDAWRPRLAIYLLAGCCLPVIVAHLLGASMRDRDG